MRVGYSHLGSPMPSRRLSRAGHSCPASIARVGVEPTNDHQGLSLAALPSLRTVPTDQQKKEQKATETTERKRHWFCRSVASVSSCSFSPSSVPDGIRTHDLHRD